MSLLTNIQRAGLWNGYSRHIVQLEPVLQEMSERGMPVEPTRFAEVEALLKANMEKARAEMVAMVPAEIRGRVSYKRPPRKRTEAHFEVDGRWFRLKPWTPSNKGLLAYIKHRGHRVPQNFKTKKETTEAMEIKRLSKETRDPLYAKVIEYRKAQTILSNHMENWRPGGDGRVHSTFYFDPATGQLSSRRPNVQNAPKHDDPEFGGYAKVFRSMVRARPETTIVELDFKSFHAQTLAFEAEDADYLRMAKLDIHSFLASHLVHDRDADACRHWDDEKLGAYLAGIKRAHKAVRDQKAKRAILGYGFGLGWKKLYEMNKESFENQSDAKRTLAMLDGVFPVAKAWRTTVRQRAHDQGYLISRHGYVRYFWEVFRWQGGEWRSGGDDSEAAIAFLPSNDAFGHIKDAMLELRRLGLDKRYGLINNIHDSLLFEWPNELIGQVGEVRAIMELPSKVLVNSICPNGLAVEVDVQAGPDWSSMRSLC